MALSLKASSNGSRRTWFLRKRVACNPASPAAMSGQGGQGAQLGAPSQASRALDGQGRSPLLARGIVTVWPRQRLGRRKTLEPGRCKAARQGELIAWTWCCVSDQSIQGAYDGKTGNEEDSEEAGSQTRTDRPAWRQALYPPGPTRPYQGER